MRASSRSARALTFAVVAASSSVACSLLVDTSGLASGPTDDASAMNADGALEAGAPDAGASDAAMGADGAPPADAAVVPCGDAGAGMIDVGGYCIDATEVTVGSYDDFLAAKVDPTSQPPKCSWNASFATKCVLAATADDDPVACVNWCDARAYCAWAGKRLCGAIGGGPSAPASQGDPAKDQWFAACSHKGARAYSYGASYVPGLCNDNMHGVGAPIPVGSIPSCVGGYPGLLDMSGNLVEWVDVCSASTGQTDDCYIRGSAFDDGDVPCSGTSPQSRDSADNTKGFRCCSAP